MTILVRPLIVVVLVLYRAHFARTNVRPVERASGLTSALLAGRPGRVCVGPPFQAPSARICFRFGAVWNDDCASPPVSLRVCLRQCAAAPRRIANDFKHLGSSSVRPGIVWVTVTWPSGFPSAERSDLVRVYRPFGITKSVCPNATENKYKNDSSCG